MILSNPVTGYFALYHADASTDLKDENHGIAALIRKACPTGDYNNLTISVGDNDTDGYYYKQVMNELDSVITNANIVPTIKLQPARAIAVNRYGLIIPENLSAGMTDLQETISDTLQRSDISISQITLGERNIGGSIGNARDRVLIHNNDTPVHPVCVFRGSRFLTIKEMQTESNLIKFSRVVQDKRPNSETSSNHSEGSFSESKEAPTSAQDVNMITKANKIKNTLNRSATDSNINFMQNKMNTRNRSKTI